MVEWMLLHVHSTVDIVKFKLGKKTNLCYIFNRFNLIDERVDKIGEG